MSGPVRGPAGGPVSGPARPLAGCPSRLVDRYDAALLDLDGVVYVGAEPVPHAAEVLRALRAAGTRLAFVTNNASRGPDTVADHLSRLGISARPSEVVTSAQAAARILADKLPPGAPVLVVGAPALAAEVTAVGLVAVERADAAPAAVVCGFSDRLGYPIFAEATLALRTGVPWVATNLDSTLPTPRGLVPGNGALVALLATATDRRPEVAGKPAAVLHRAAAGRVKATRPLVVGDRLDTDIEAASAAGFDSLLVLTGVADLAALLRAPAGQRPTYLSEDLRGLLEAHPPVCRDGSVFRCRRARAELGDRTVTVVGDGSPDDAVRAAAAAAWAGYDEGASRLELVGLPDRPGGGR